MTASYSMDFPHQQSPSGTVTRSSRPCSEMNSLGDQLLRSSISPEPASLNPLTVTAPPPYSTGSSSAFSAAPPPYQSSSTTRSRRRAINSIRERKSQLQQEMHRANANAPHRQVDGLFKNATSTDVLFLMDATNSMKPYLETAKQQVIKIVAEIKETFLNESDVRVAVVAYRDHDCAAQTEFLDFTCSFDEVHSFVNQIKPVGGYDIPEDVLGGLEQALQSSWKYPTRCLIHIGDAPPHGTIFSSMTCDKYPRAGSEPHGLTYEPLIKRLIKLNINYAMLRITWQTDRMSKMFAGVYGYENSQLHCYNEYRHLTVDAKADRDSTKPRYEEVLLGASYSDLKSLVVKTVTNTISQTMGRGSESLRAPRPRPSGGASISNGLAAIREDEDDETASTEYGGEEPTLETMLPQWDNPAWLSQRLDVVAFSPVADVYNANTLNDLIASDEHIRLGHGDFVVLTRSRAFAKGANRQAHYARTAASRSRFVVKSFITPGHGRPAVIEDMRSQTLCKAFALEFNGLLEIEPPLDFVVSVCLESKSADGTVDTATECQSLEPFVSGNYVKYNNNCGYVNRELANDHFNLIAQAFSHFTFERSWGLFLVSDLQGVGHLLTDPSVQTKDPERFKLNSTNLGEEGFKCFLATHQCNKFCEQLGLKSNKKMFMTGQWEFRETWPAMAPTVCCSNRLCRGIIRLETARSSDDFPGYSWCDACWSQLQFSLCKAICEAPGSVHEFQVSRFFHESQGELMPHHCSQHRAKDPSTSGAAAVGGGVFNRMKTRMSIGSISGKAW